MSKKVLEEIRGKDSQELQSQLSDLKKQQFDLRFRADAEQVAQTSRHQQIRRQIARIKTVLGERERQNGTNQ